MRELWISPEVRDVCRAYGRRTITGKVVRWAMADVLATHDPDYGLDFTPKCGVLVFIPRSGCWAFDWYPLTDWDGHAGARAAESRALAATR